MQFNRSIAFTASWRHTLFIALMLGLLVGGILVFLQPFDTYGNTMPYKTLKLWGYSLCVFIPVLIHHAVELNWYRKQDKQWYLYNELLSLFTGIILIALCCYSYSSGYINENTLNAIDFINWMKSFGLPFAPFIIPLWWLLRHQYSQIKLPRFKNNLKPIRIEGSNQNELLELSPEAFVMAQAQANYVDVYLKTDTHFEKHMLRLTLSALVDQLPMAVQVHRSYLVNLKYAHALRGNTRKGSMHMAVVDTEIPVSPKYFKALKKRVQFHP